MPELRRRQDDQTGQRWVDDNWDIRVRIQEANGGVMPDIPNFTNSKFPNDDNWSAENLPEILLYVVPPRSVYEGKPIDLLEEDGQLVEGQSGRPLRRFPCLPRRVSLTVPGWLIETWRRIDPRIEYGDIIDRMDVTPYGSFPPFKLPSRNSLQNHAFRGCRKLLNMWVEYNRVRVPSRAAIQAIENLSLQNFLDNSLLDRHADYPDRLVKVQLCNRRRGGLHYKAPVQLTEDTLQCDSFSADHFLINDLNYDIDLENVIRDAESLLYDLQERAQKHGLKNWDQLPRGCIPPTWYSRSKARFLSADVYDWGCDICNYKAKDELIEYGQQLIVENAALSCTEQGSSPSRSNASARKRGVLKRKPEEDISPTTYCKKARTFRKIRFLESDEDSADEGYETDTEIDFKTLSQCSYVRLSNGFESAEVFGPAQVCGKQSEAQSIVRVDDGGVVGSKLPHDPALHVPTGGNAKWRNGFRSENVVNTAGAPENTTSDNSSASNGYFDELSSFASNSSVRTAGYESSTPQSSFQSSSPSTGDRYDSSPVSSNTTGSSITVSEPDLGLSDIEWLTAYSPANEVEDRKGRGTNNDQEDGSFDQAVFSQVAAYICEEGVDVAQDRQPFNEHLHRDGIDEFLSELFGPPLPRR